MTPLNIESRCRTCGRPIVWASTRYGRRMPLDRDPSSVGTVELVAGVAYVVRSVQPPLRVRYSVHLDTCPQGNLFGEARR